jgi:hypothetical protein
LGEKGAEGRGDARGVVVSGNDDRDHN